MTGAGNVEVSVDVVSRVPPYEQIQAQIATQIHSGALAEGDRLPTVRALAADLGVAAGTVARAYTELEADGLVEGRRRFGTVVTGTAGDPAQARLRVAANRLVTASRADGLGDEEILVAVHIALSDQVAH